MDTLTTMWIPLPGSRGMGIVGGMLLVSVSGIGGLLMMAVSLMVRYVQTTRAGDGVPLSTR